ncbi:hypothetical protein [Lentzea flava]|uniref:Uncharacterized protein n=1 Tax=Lentzea flava TaxID=103732 RepID=A0ABQ2UH58_9PSEU|nr:hypothetical protein [Lentzea flava]MCP2198691.1 hypothetical protein [Lentzea flava]GGU29392.1 hypothetical protein GCM10010178_22010 [Lentzea flava]
MAGGGARALLLRAAALGGLTAAAWLLGGTDAFADTGEPPAVEIRAEAAQDAPQLLEDPAGWAKAFTSSVLQTHRTQKLAPPPVVTKPQEPEDEPEDEGPVLDFTGGSQSNTRSGTVTNQAPPEVMKAKAEARAAAKAAKAAAEAPPPAPPAPPVVPVKKVVPQLPDLPVPGPAKTEPSPKSDLNWSVPGHDLPLPAPQQAPVVATASASSGHSDNSGGTRGVLAVLTSHNSLFPPSRWSVEERRDGRCPGSLPGLPSTSPD